MLSDWPIYLIGLHMIGQLNMTERLHDISSNRMLQHQSIREKIQSPSYFNYIVIKTYFTSNN